MFHKSELWLPMASPFHQRKLHDKLESQRILGLLCTLLVLGFPTLLVQVICTPLHLRMPIFCQWIRLGLYQINCKKLYNLFVPVSIFFSSTDNLRKIHISPEKSQYSSKCEMVLSFLCHYVSDLVRWFVKRNVTKHRFHVYRYCYFTGKNMNDLFLKVHCKLWYSSIQFEQFNDLLIN